MPPERHLLSKEVRSGESELPQIKVLKSEAVEHFSNTLLQGEGALVGAVASADPRRAPVHVERLCLAQLSKAAWGELLHPLTCRGVSMCSAAPLGQGSAPCHISPGKSHPRHPSCPMAAPLRVNSTLLIHTAPSAAPREIPQSRRTFFPN